MDSAFAHNNYHLLIKSCIPSLDTTIEKIEVANKVTSMLQSSEWGMRAFQPLRPQTKDQISMEYRWEHKLMM